MTTEEMLIESVVVATAQSVGILCIVWMFAIVLRACYHAWQAALNGIARDL